MRRTAVVIAYVLSAGLVVSTSSAQTPTKREDRTEKRLAIPGEALVEDELLGNRDLEKALTGQRWAILIGVDQFSPGITPLRYPASDAHAIRRALISRSATGYAPSRILVIAAGGKAEPTRAAILSELDRAAERIGPGDSLLVFVSTHGVEVGGVPSLIPSDATISEAEVVGGIGLDTLLHRLDRIPAAEQVLVLDACHSGASQTMPSGVAPWGEGAAATLEQGAVNRVIISSSRLDEVSYEDPALGAGVLAHYFTQALSDDRRDLDFDGEISVDEAFEVVQSGVAEWSVGTGKKQTPWKLSSVGRTIDLIRVAPEVVESDEAIRVGSLTWKAVVRKTDESTHLNMMISTEDVECNEALVEIRLVFQGNRTVMTQKPIRCSLRMNALSIRVPGRPSRIVVSDFLLDPASKEPGARVRATRQMK